jgi:hypothetical protein
MSESPGTNDIPVTENHLPEDAAAARIRRWNRFYKIAVIWVAGWSSIILEKIVELESLVGGLQHGGLGGAFTSPFLLIITLPLAWLGSRIGSWEKWRKHQLWFTLGLPALFLLLGPAGALHGRAFPQARFHRFTGVEFPREARVERCMIDDGVGPFADPLFIYELTCPAAETDRLIRELKLNKYPSSSGSSSTGSGTPRSRSGWAIAETWSGGDDRYGHFYELRTDATRTRIWLMCAGI